MQKVKDWRRPISRARTKLKDALLAMLQASGQYTPKSSSELTTIRGVGVPFFGERPRSNAGLCDQIEHIRLFANPRPEFETVSDLYYGPTGMAWHNGRLIERFSLRRPSVKEALNRPDTDGARFIERATVIECDYPYSYGDWVQAYLITVLMASEIQGPVIIPAHLARKSYVERDLKICGIDYIESDRWSHIGKATILRKRNVGLSWCLPEVDAFRSAFDIDAVEPTMGSLTYFGRFDFPGEIDRRGFPSETVAEVVARLGGRVERQASLSPFTAPNFASCVETVIMDHGSGGINAMFWRPKTLIELFTGNWWSNNNLFSAYHCGVKNHAVLNVDGVGEEEIQRKIKVTLAHFESNHGSI